MDDNEYNQQAADFAKKHDVWMNVLDKEYGIHFNDDCLRWIFEIELGTPLGSYVLKYGQSLNGGETKPTLYDVLTCLVKSNPGSIDDFTNDYGYGSNSKISEHIAMYDRVATEWAGMSRIFTAAQLEELQEIN